MPIGVGKYLQAIDLTGKTLFRHQKIIATITQINTHRMFNNFYLQEIHTDRNQILDSADR